jgi:hypothetical protein
VGWGWGMFWFAAPVPKIGCNVGPKAQHCNHPHPHERGWGMFRYAAPSQRARKPQEKNKNQKQNKKRRSQKKKNNNEKTQKTKNPKNKNTKTKTSKKCKKPEKQQKDVFCEWCIGFTYICLAPCVFCKVSVGARTGQGRTDQERPGKARRCQERP